MKVSDCCKAEMTVSTVTTMTPERIAVVKTVKVCSKCLNKARAINPFKEEKKKHDTPNKLARPKH